MSPNHQSIQMPPFQDILRRILGALMILSFLANVLERNSWTFQMSIRQCFKCMFNLTEIKFWSSQKMLLTSLGKLFTLCMTECLCSLTGPIQGTFQTPTCSSTSWFSNWTKHGAIYFILKRLIKNSIQAITTLLIQFQDKILNRILILT